MTVGEQINQSLRAITQPLVAQLREIELQITVREDEMKELRAARTKLVTIVRQIDPELAPKKKNYTGKSLVPVKEETVQEVLLWLKEFVNGDEFYASGLMKEGIPISQSQVSKAVNVLHERGVITLVRQGTGGSKFYKVVA